MVTNLIQLIVKEVQGLQIFWQTAGKKKISLILPLEHLFDT